jgi:PEP-CTERM motif
MKNLKNITLSALVLAMAPLAHAQTTTVFDSNTTPWSSEANGTIVPIPAISGAALGGTVSTTSGGVTTLATPANPSTAPGYGSYGADFFNIPGGITNNSGIWTLSTTINVPNPGVTLHGEAFDNIDFGFDSFSNVNGPVEASLTGPTATIESSLVYGTPAPSFHTAGGTVAANTTVVSTPATSAAGVPIQIILNTDTPGWTVEYLDNGVPKLFSTNGGATSSDLVSYDPSGNPTITQFGLDVDTGSDATTVTFANTTLTDTVAAAPEPSTYALLVGGLGLLFFIQRMRKNSVRA